jgi:hypothetical protein
MSTKCSFGYSHENPAYHLYEDFEEPGMVLVELPRECLHDQCADTVTLKMTPALWDAIRRHACPNSIPADFWETYQIDTKYLEELAATNPPPEPEAT